MATELLALGSRGSRLRVTAEQISLGRPLAANEEPTFDAAYEVDAYPFAGTLRDALLLSDLQVWHDALQHLRPPGELRLGGERSAELQLLLDSAGRDELWVVEVRLVRSGDDPWPEIRYLIFNVEPFVAPAVAAVAALLREHS